MPSLNCQQQFEQPILDGIKTGTIRKYRKDGRPPCKIGDHLKLYVGLRTKTCRLIATVRVISINHIKISDACWVRRCTDKTMDISIDDHPLDYITSTSHDHLCLFKLVNMEGFKSPRTMRDWFVKHHKIDQLPFYGWHIQWEAM